MLTTNLKQMRIEKLWSQQELANRAGISIYTVCKGENGENLSLLTVQKICGALGCVPTDLGDYNG